MSYYKLTKEGINKAQRFIKECKAKRKEIIDAGKDTADDTNLPTVEDIEADLNFTGFDDEMNYYNCWGVTDNYSSEPLSLDIDKDFYDSEAKDAELKEFAKETAYELYKQDWLRRMDQKSWKQTANEYIESVAESDYEEGFGIIADDFSDYIEENGFGSSLYVCYDEFLDAEFTDQEYITELVGEGPLLDIIKKIWEAEKDEES